MENNNKKTQKEKTEAFKTIKELEDSRFALMNILEDVEEERKKAEEEKNKTLAIVNNFADGILVFNRENKLLLINPQAEKFFKIQGDKIIDRTISELDKLPDFKKLIDLVGPKVKKIFRKELVIDESLILEVSTIIIEQDLGILLILHDITREKMIERIKTEFVSIAAHQLRTPLSAIKWTLKMLLEGDLGKTSAKQREFISDTYQSNERMISLINDLLNTARIEEGKYLYKPTLIDFQDILVPIIDSFKEKISIKEITMEFKKPGEKIPEISADSDKLKLAVQNLVDNAVKYTTPKGKIVISLEHKKNEKEILFSIKDTGVGIPKHQQKRVFSKFFRGDNVIRMETEGSGLGIFISKNIIEAHGGKMWFESEEQKGTTFYFSLPAKK